ncbi:MAG: hypothetical protein M1587_10520 [Thaumarchaeota archaeon]|nr:hypothetical protein [Nitrososphaerota archaeon]
MALFKYYAGATVPDPFTFNQTTGLYRPNPNSSGRLGILKQDIPYALNQQGYSKAIMDVGQVSGYPPQKTIIGASSTSGADQILSLIDNGYADFYFDEPGNTGHDSLDYVNTMMPIIHTAGGRVWIGDCIQCLDGHTPHWGLLQNADYILCDNYQDLCLYSDACLGEPTTSNSTALQNIYNYFKSQLGSKFVGAFVCSNKAIWGYLNTVYDWMNSNVQSPWVLFYSDDQNQDANIHHLADVAWSDYQWLQQDIRKYEQQYVAISGVNWAPDGTNGYSTVGSADYPITQLTANPDGTYTDPTGKIVTLSQFWDTQQTGSYTDVWQ